MQQVDGCVDDCKITQYIQQSFL